MNYELALELKKAGFPQEAGDGRFLIDERKPYLHNGKIYGKESVDSWASRNAYAPTLSELIEACGEEFRFLSKDFFGWVAVSNKEAENPEAHMHVKQICQTPEEAVARLWLALNKK